MTDIEETLGSMLTLRGWRGRIVPLDRLRDLAEAIQGAYGRGLLDDTFYRETLSWFSFDPPEDLPAARSMIIIAVPTPPMRLWFAWHGERLPVIVPPTYASYTPRTERVRAAVADWLAPRGYRLVGSRLPLKTLAVRSGLAEYGRNNICYVRGMGSYLQLVGAFSDLPCTADPWRESKSLDRCASCTTCRRLCPTGAIGDDRFLLRAEVCLTFHNERPQEFADWIDPSWHHCLIGCMCCQTFCPENLDVRDWVEDRAEFTAEETAAIMDSLPHDQLPATTAAKLAELEINEEYRLLQRNLAAAIRSGRRQNGCQQWAERVPGL